MEKIYEIKVKVTEEMSASAMGSGTLNVLATPAVAALMENASCKLAQKFLDQGITTVGTVLNIEHMSPTPVGAEVRAVSELTEQNGRSFSFNVSAYDEKGIIAKGTHTRFSVKSDSFQAKADNKLS